MGFTIDTGMNKTIIIISLITFMVFIIPQVYADTIIRSFNLTEHEANNSNINDDYCYTSTCLLQRANELMDEAETQAYWNDINSQYYLSDLDKAVEELERLD